MSISRREFIGTAAAAGLAAGTASAKGVLPKRVLGRTGAEVSILAMGGGSRFLSYEDEGKALEAMNHAIDLGVTYIDTAFNYGRGLSETRVGKIMATRRKEVWLATKIPNRKGDEAMKTIEGSLKRLQTDQIDLIHIHQLMDEDDLAAIEAKDGILNVLYKLRDQKVCKAIGITCHHNPYVLKTALEHNDFDCTQMALNAALVGMKPGGEKGMIINPDMKPSFETVALPVAQKKKLGIIAMKIYGADGLVGQAPSAKLLYYSLSLPQVALAVVGMPKMSLIEENVNLAKGYKALPKTEMSELSAALSTKNKLALDRYLQKHVDSYEV
jgi:aryl-alcohol dehydrogenase-like predicted oxidoreductase